MNTLALVDCNNFFVSCERVFAPRLEKRPVIVLSNNDGCVISRSEEAKALNIPMGVPFFEVRPIAVEQRVAVISANHELYMDMSRRVSCLLAEYAQEIETYSIDESFLLLSPSCPYEKWAHALPGEVWRHTGLPVSVGLGPTKVLAKLASDLAKKNGGILSLMNPLLREEILRTLPVDKVWGLAAASARRLTVHGIYEAGDLAKARDSAVRDALGVGGLKIAAELRGEPRLPLNATPPPRQSVTVSRSFAAPVEDFDSLWSALTTFVAQAAERLRRNGLIAGEVSVYVGWRENKLARAQAGRQRLSPSAATPPLLAAARACLARIFLLRRRHKKIGVVLSLLQPAASAQVDLFDDPRARRQNRLMIALDSLNASLGPGTVRYAASGLSGRWTSRCENRSPCYTTRWEDLPRVFSSAAAASSI